MGKRVLIATTDPQDPTPGVASWKASVFDLPGNDFPMLGYDANGIYISVNSSVAPSTPPAPPQGQRSPQFVFIPRAKALAYPPDVDDIKVIGPLHYEDFGDNLYPVIDQSGGNLPYGTLVGIDNVSKSHLTYALFSPQSGKIEKYGKIEVTPFEPVNMGTRVSQPDAFHSVIWSGEGPVAAPISDGSNIWLAQTVFRVNEQRLAVRWYRLAIDPQTRVPSLAYSGELFQPFYDYFNPSILSFGKDDYTVVSMSRSGNGQPVPKDPNNPLCGNLGAYVALVTEATIGYETFVLQSGQIPNYVPQNGQRWGDYSTICRDPDPANGRKVWIINQYALKDGASTSQWGNVIASVDVPVP
jgi:hypothetical protein